MIEIGTSYIMEDEDCFCLTESDMKSPMGQRRYRSYTVIRSDRLATYREDLGDSKDFKNVDPICVPGGVIDERTRRIEVFHTVGELLDIVRQRRIQKAFDKRELVGLDNIK